MSSGSNDTQERSFLGRGWGFPPTFSKATRSVVMAADEADIEESLQILLGTAVGERFLQPRYGCNLKQFLFEPLNTTTQTYLRGLLRQAVLHFEPRVRLNDVRVTADAAAGGQVAITIDYTVRTTNSRFNRVYPFFLNEATER